MVICIFGRKSYVQKAPQDIQRQLGEGSVCFRRDCPGACQAYNHKRFCTWMICIPIFPLSSSTIVVCQRCGIKYEFSYYLKKAKERRRLVIPAARLVELPAPHTAATAAPLAETPMAEAEALETQDACGEKDSLVVATATEIV